MKLHRLPPWLKAAIAAVIALLWIVVIASILRDGSAGILVGFVPLSGLLLGMMFRRTH